NTLLITGLSGHGFKFASVLGEKKLLINQLASEEQLKLNPPQDLRSAIEKIGWKNRPITA
ncbi:hypothetical protein ACVWBZ_17925, partial [Escherichia coli]